MFVYGTCVQMYRYFWTDLRHSSMWAPTRLQIEQQQTTSSFWFVDEIIDNRCALLSCQDFLKKLDLNLLQCPRPLITKHPVPFANSDPERSLALRRRTKQYDRVRPVKRQNERRAAKPNITHHTGPILLPYVHSLSFCMRNNQCNRYNTQRNARQARFIISANIAGVLSGNRKSVAMVHVT